MHLQFWRGDQLCRVLIKRTGRVVGQAAAQVNLLASLLAATSSRPDLLSSGGCSFELIQLPDNGYLFPLAVQCPTRFSDISLPKLMHKKSYCVFGRIYFFSVLKYIIVSLGGCLDLECVLLAPEQSKVGQLLFS